MGGGGCANQFGQELREERLQQAWRDSLRLQAMMASQFWRIQANPDTHPNHWCHASMAFMQYSAYSKLIRSCQK